MDAGSMIASQDGPVPSVWVPVRHSPALVIIFSRSRVCASSSRSLPALLLLLLPSHCLVPNY